MDLCLKLQGSMQRCITIICPPAAVAALKGAWVHGYLFNKKVLPGGTGGVSYGRVHVTARFDARNF